MGSSPASLKILRQFHLNLVVAKHRQLLSKKQLSNNRSAGFTLIELIVVIIIIGVLSAIAAPGWLAFLNQQQVSKVNDAVLSAIQTAQSEAKSTKLSYSVSFQTNNGTLQFAVYQPANYPSSSSSSPPIPPSTSTVWQTLGSTLDTKPGQVLLGSNISSENTAFSSPSQDLSYPSASYQIPPITFNYMGNVTDPNTNAGFNSNNGKGLIIAVAAPQGGNNSATPSVATQRCVIVKTLLGAMQIGKGSECSTHN